MRASFREIKIADYARRSDPRAGLGRGVRPSPISTVTRRPAERAIAQSGRPRAFWKARSRPTATSREAATEWHVVPLVFVLAAIGAVVALVVAPVYLDRFRRELSRAEEIEQVARGLGLTFARVDPAYPGSTAFLYPFELFSRGIEQTCENFIRGTIEGVDLVAFDFLYRQRVDSDGEPGGKLRSEPVRFSCALATVDGERPHVVVEPASAPLPDRAGGEPVRLEWGAFNARYRVISPDRGFAAALLDLALMTWLVDEAPRLPLTYEIQRDQVLCRAPGLAPKDVAGFVNALPEFARRISRGASD